MHSWNCLYISFIRPLLEYGRPVWDGCTQTDADKLESIQMAVDRIITGDMKCTSTTKLYEEIEWKTLAERRKKAKLFLMYKIINNLTSSYLHNLLRPEIPPTVSHQRSDRYHFRARTTLFDKSFVPSPVRLWNQLPSEIREATCTPLSQIKSKLTVSPNEPVQHTELNSF